MQPMYLEAYSNGRLIKIFKKAFRKLESCSICPRGCQVNRLKSEQGFCKTGLKAKVCSFMLHHGEEPPISGERGSGTIFFSHCNMKCVYCQNYEFSQLGQGGREVEPEELASFMIRLQERGAHNINLVTPTHVMPQILEALLIAIPQGLKIPLVYNTGGYELAEIVKLLEGIIDIYLPDMRYADNEAALKYSSARDYPRYNQESLKEMHRQVGVAKIDALGIIEKGLIIRHLVLPNNISGTDKIMRFISRELSKDTYISLMSQYSPCYQADRFKEISRRINQEEYKIAQQVMQQRGLHNGWIQEAGGLDRFAGIHIKPNLEESDRR
jgi:putative pyruvate formate lyase activating enzyme